VDRDSWVVIRLLVFALCPLCSLWLFVLEVIRVYLRLSAVPNLMADLACLAALAVQLLILSFSVSSVFSVAFCFLKLSASIGVHRRLIY